MRTFCTRGAAPSARPLPATAGAVLTAPLALIMRCSTLAQVVDFPEFSFASRRRCERLERSGRIRFRPHGDATSRRPAGSVPTRRSGRQARRQSKQERIHDKVSRPKTNAGPWAQPDRPASSRFGLRPSDRKLATKPFSHCLARANAGGARGRLTAPALPPVQGDSFRFLSFLVHLVAVAARRASAIERSRRTAAPKECR